MQYQLFVQSHSNQKFIASVVGIPMVNGEGVTENEAIAQAKASLQSQLATGKFVKIEVDSIYQATSQETSQETDPWLKHLGLFSNDPSFDNFLDEVAIYRQEVERQEINQNRS